MALGSLAVLTACGGGSAVDSAGESIGVVPTPAPSPTPSPSPTPTPTPAAGDQPEETSLDPIPPNTYPAAATASVESVDYPIGATSVDVPIRLDHATPNTVFVHVKTRNGSGANYVYSGAYYTPIDKYVIFRPGDPLVQTVTIPIAKTVEGGHFQLIFPEVPQGAKQGNAIGELTSRTGASPTTPITQGFRAPRTFEHGRLLYEMDPSTVRWSDSGGPGVWSTSFTQGRTQAANQETGLYLDNQLYPQAEPAVAVADGALVLHSQKLAQPIIYRGVGYYYGAAALDGRNMPETQITYGQYEWTATMPDRPGSWPALWLVGVKGWPPEIDVYEGFGQNASFDFDRDISSTIHGGPVNSASFERGMWVDATKAYGIEHIARAAHRYALDIEPDYITWFVDGVETFQARNPFSGAFYPLMTVAVKTTDNYASGSGDMQIMSFKVWTN